ncbi:MAG TPA: tetraacyldisaccharide 4'-kinase [Gammaproteobacteria bacterium]|nr:tetraacyldisaccharide 4'-kinase [Gammaproteobacteria bacterium]
MWQARHPLALLLSPLSLLFLLISRLRRAAYQLHLKKVYRAPAPVIVVGNISVGGTGKTPLVIWLCRHLTHIGYRPGVVLRGYGGTATRWPQQVLAGSDPDVVGDEAVVIASETACPVCVDPNRARAARELLEHHPCDVIISDDGLQHYALARDIEIAVIDGERRFGNGLLLPAGPLREPVSRLRTVDFVIMNQPCSPDYHCIALAPGHLTNLATGEVRRIEEMKGSRVHAVSGIGNPGRFYQLLIDAGMQVDENSYPDHHKFSAADIGFNDDLAVIMTAKDAVKCRPYATDKHWYLKLDVQPSADFISQFTATLELKTNYETE